MSINDYLKVEELGRLVASSPPTVSRVVNFYERLYEATMDMVSKFSFNGDYTGGEIASTLNQHALDILRFFRHARKKQPTPSAVELWNLKDWELEQEKQRALAMLRMASKECSTMVGKKCTWLSDRWEESINATVNDATAIFHRLIERIRPEIEFDCPNCSLATPSAGEFFKKTACSFGTAEVILRKHGATFGQDALAVHATIYDGRVDFRVGDAPGHMTELTGDRLIYYDDDMPVNRVMKYLLGRAGVTAEIVTGELPGLKGRLLKKKPVLLGATIAMATSMDFRVNAYSNILYALKSHEYDLNVSEAIKTFWFAKPSNVLVGTIEHAIKELGVKYPPSPAYLSRIEKTILDEIVLPGLRKRGLKG